MTEAFARYRELIDDWETFQAVIQRPLPTTIWTNTLRVTPANLTRLLGQPATPLPWYPGAFRLPPNIMPGLHWAYMAGLYHVQEEVSLLPVMLLDIQPGERVFDLCAAPGNKTAQIGVLLGNRGTVVANDRSAGRMRAARHALNRLGLLNITTTTSDGANYPRDAGFFDKVLVDAPCTCEGTCRKDSSVMDRVFLKDSKKLAGSQTALLRKGVQRCRPGGRIVYATCTFAPEENELVIDAILREFNGRIRLLPAQIPGFTSSPGITEWEGQKLDDSLSLTMRVWPHQNDTGGFFVAVLEKGEQSSVSSEQLSVYSENRPPKTDNCTLTTDHWTEERQPWLDIISDRFGFEPDVFADYAIVRWGRKGVYTINQDHILLKRPSPDAVGMIFMRTEGKYPKLTTGAAMLVGHHAKRNFIDLEPSQVQDFMARRDFNIMPDQAPHCTGTGYVLLRYQSVSLGIAVYRPHLNLVESLYPKGWARKNVRVGVLAGKQAAPPYPPLDAPLPKL